MFKLNLDVPQSESLVQVNTTDNRGLTPDELSEQCVEKIYSDIMQRCKPLQLDVYARYMRRGGLDINPWRSSRYSFPPSLRQVRQ